MRIALISYEYPPETGRGGIGTYMHQAAHMLSARGHSVEVFAGATEKDSVACDGAVLVNRVFARDRREFHPTVAGTFAERHRIAPFDLVEGPDYMADSLTIRQRFPEVPHLIRLHTPSFLLKKLFLGRTTLAQKARFIAGSLRKGKWPKPYWTYSRQTDPEYRIAASLPFILFPSREIGKIVSRKWDIPIERLIQQSYPFQPADAFLSIGIEKTSGGAARITFLGKLEKRKGIFPLMEAIPAICRKYPAVRFRFVGSPHPSPVKGMDMQAYMEDRLADYKENLEFTGSVPYDQIPAHLAETDICIFPSLWENFPNVCLEAMSAGRAVVGSRNGGMAEMLGNDEYGLLIDPYKPKTIVAALEKLIEDPELRYRFGHLGREKILREYNYDRIGALTEEVYSMIIEKWPKG